MAAQGVVVSVLSQELPPGLPLMSHIDPERSNTSMATRSFREAWPLTARAVELNPRYLINHAGTLVVAVTVTCRRLALLGELTTTTLAIVMTVPVVDQLPGGKF